MNEAIISVHNVGKMYHLYERPQDRLKEAIFRPFTHKNYGREFWALNDISFNVFRGQTIGIVGKNGSGKSTLLQIIAGTLKPTTGNLKVNGRISALLELGSGFNPEFTGRENVFINGAILGLSEEQMRERFADIASFADIGDFIDQPVKVYSSGMYVRLAFAVAVHVDANILIVDEALSVGDMEFQGKCITKIKQFVENPDNTLLFVSHSIDSVKSICRKTLYLDQGRQVDYGDSEDVCDKYMATVRGFGNNNNVNFSMSKSEVLIPEDVSRNPQIRIEGFSNDEKNKDLKNYIRFQNSVIANDSWKTISSGEIYPGSYKLRITITKKNSDILKFKRFKVSRHLVEYYLQEQELLSSIGENWSNELSEEGDLIFSYHGREDTELEINFIGHKISFDLSNTTSSSGVMDRIDLAITANLISNFLPGVASKLYIPSEEFKKRVAQFRYGNQSASIMNAEILDESYRPVEMVRVDEDFIIRLHLMANIDLDICNIGCVIRDHTGRDIICLTTFDHETNWVSWKAGQPRIVDYKLKTILCPGVYTVSAGMSRTVPVTTPQDEVFFDFCQNVATFQVTNSIVGRPCWSVVDVQSEIKFFC